jgi:hypothetical protein
MQFDVRMLFVVIGFSTMFFSRVAVFKQWVACCLRCVYGELHDVWEGKGYIVSVPTVL